MNMKKLEYILLGLLVGFAMGACSPMMRMRVSLTPFSRKANPTKSYLIRYAKSALKLPQNGE